MARQAVIRFAGEPGKASHFLKLGPMDLVNPSERSFEGGDEITVEIADIPGKPDCVDITFDDGEIALEVPKEFFAILREINGR